MLTIYLFYFDFFYSVFDFAIDFIMLFLYFVNDKKFLNFDCNFRLLFHFSYFYYINDSYFKTMKNYLFLNYQFIILLQEEKFMKFYFTDYLLNLVIILKSFQIRYLNFEFIHLIFYYFHKEI